MRNICVVVFGLAIAICTNGTAFAQFGGSDDGEPGFLEQFAFIFFNSPAELKITADTSITGNFETDVTQSSSNGLSVTGTAGDIQRKSGFDFRASFGGPVVGAWGPNTFDGSGIFSVANLDNATPGDEASFTVQRDSFWLFYGGWEFVLFAPDGTSAPFNNGVQPLQGSTNFAPTSTDPNIPAIEGLTPVAPMVPSFGSGNKKRAGKVSLTPWAGVRFEDVKVRYQTTEAGTTYNFSNDQSFSALSYGADVEVFVTDDIFLRLTWARDQMPSFDVSGQAFNFHTANASSTTVDRVMVGAGIALN